MNKSDILVSRRQHTKKSSAGQIYLGQSETPFCYTLEDVSRGPNIKIPKETAIPVGDYLWKISFSNRFQREMIMIYTEPNEYEIKKAGISFKGVRIHGGNTSENSEGCILVAHNRIDADKIWGTAETSVTQWAKDVGGKGHLYVRNN